MLQDIMPGTEEQLNKEVTAGYVGFDPTADSLHIGSLVPILLLVHLQKAGHRPIALVGGATGMVGDPSGKSEERNMLSEEVLQKNIACIRAQLERFLNFDSNKATGAAMVNNYDWFKEISFLDFIRDAGKHITALCGLLNPVTHHLEWCSAGHYPPPILIKPDRSTETLNSSSFPLGLVTDLTLTTQTTSLTPQSQLLFCSDGAIEVFEGGTAEQLAQLITALSTREFDPPAHLPDDLTILSLTRN